MPDKLGGPSAYVNEAATGINGATDDQIIAAAQYAF